MSYDVIVVGLGGMGSAAAAHLSRRGQRVLGIEQFGPAHDRGSSHGESRMIRQAYYEDPSYVPLLLRAYELWDDLDRDSPGIITVTGGLMMGTAESATVAGSLASAREWNLPHEVLDAAAIRRRFPAFTPSEGTLAVLEEHAGYVLPEQTVRTHLARAGSAGADLRFHEKVLRWDTDADIVTVETDQGRYQAPKLVLSPGSWAPDLLHLPQLPLQVERQLLYWFAPRDGVDLHRGPLQPVFIWQDLDGLQLYGFPALGAEEDGVKVAFYRGAGRLADPDDLDRVIHDDEVTLMHNRLASHLPGLAGRFLHGIACMYTNTIDHNFVVGQHPAHPQVTIAAGFSGHGFKFVPVVGEIIADLVLDGRTSHPIDMFSPHRFDASVKAQQHKKTR